MALSRPALPERITTKISLYSGIDGSCIVRSPEFDQQFNETMYTCSVCLSLPRSPVSIGCAHIFCDHCIRRVLVTAMGFPIGTAGCPMCRTRFTVRNLLSFDHWPGLAKNAWDIVKVRCPQGPSNDMEIRCEAGWYQPELCTFVGSITALKQHETSECPNRIIECPNATCKKLGSANFVAHHYAKCNLMKVFCHMCGLAKYDSQGLHNCVEALQTQLSGNKKS